MSFDIKFLTSRHLSRIIVCVVQPYDTEFIERISTLFFRQCCLKQFYIRHFSRTIPKNYIQVLCLCFIAVSISSDITSSKLPYPNEYFRKHSATFSETYIANPSQIRKMKYFSIQPLQRITSTLSLFFKIALVFKQTLYFVL